MEGDLTNGALLIPENECPGDTGAGVVPFEKVINVIPRDFDGSVLRIAGRAGDGGIREDLEQRIRVGDSQRFQNEPGGLEPRQRVKQLVEFQPGEHVSFGCDPGQANVEAFSCKRITRTAQIQGKP